MKREKRKEEYKRLIKLIDETALGYVYDMMNNDSGYRCEKVDTLLEALKDSLENILEEES